MAIYVTGRRMVRKHFILIAEVESRILKKILEGPVYSTLRNKKKIKRLDDMVLEKVAKLDALFTADMYDVIWCRASGLAELKEEHPELSEWEYAEYEKIEDEDINEWRR